MGEKKKKKKNLERKEGDVHMSFEESSSIISGTSESHI